MRINIILPEGTRERFADLCRHIRVGGGKTPRKLSMNAALNLLIDAVLAERVSLPDLMSGQAEQDKPKGRKGKPPR